MLRSVSRLAEHADRRRSEHRLGGIAGLFRGDSLLRRYEPDARSPGVAMRKILFASALALSMAMAPAHAVLFDFSYTLAGGDTLAGTLDGTLQPDGNKVIVNSIVDFATFNGVDGPSLPLVDDAAMLGGDPFVSLNGDFMDLAACTNPCFDGFFFFGPNLGGAVFLRE